jgi:hypothetical protein
MRGTSEMNEAKIKQVLEDADTINEFRNYILILHSFAEKTTEEYSIPESVSEYA